MKHSYHARQQDLLPLIEQFERQLKNGRDWELSETEFLQAADYYERIDLVEKALEAVEHGLQQHDCSANLHAHKAHLLLRIARADQALQLIDLAEAFGYSRMRLELLRARAFTQKRNYDTALCLLQGLKCSNHGTPTERSEIHYQEAHIHEKQENFERMFSSLRQSLLLNPHHQNALERLYYCLDMGEWGSESVELCGYLIDENPYSYLAWYNLGHAYYAQFRYEKAIEAFEFCFLINENFIPAYYDCADVYLQICDFSGALHCYRELLAFGEPNAELLFKLGLCHESLGQLEEARCLFFRALRRHPKHEEVYFHIGECFAREENWATAAEYYQKALDFDQHREDILSAQADALLRLGRFREVEPLLIAATEVLPEQSYLWMRLARFYLSMGQAEKALARLEDAEIDAYGAEMCYARAACHAHLDRMTEALDALGEGLQLNFDQHYLFFELAPNRRADKQVRAAIHYFRYD
ncbi:MAG: tetratricopeptide repeat protein [Bacteroidota bacterium]